jgi:fructose-1,6-bisphosphatase/inositol monophosphatase family enzyme
MGKLSESEINDLYAFCKDIAQSAGSIILEGSKAIRNHQVAGDIKEKLNPVDLVTEWDVKVENHVSNAIKERYPDYGLYI